MTRRYVTQGRILIAELKQRTMTYAQMLRFGQGNSPWKRVAECLWPDEKLIKGKAALALELRALWPALLWGAEPIAPHVAAWLDEVYGSERLAQLRAEAEASISLDGEPSMSFAGVRYPLPDRFCDEDDSEKPTATTSERIIQGLAKSGVLAKPKSQ